MPKLSRRHGRSNQLSSLIMTATMNRHQQLRKQGAPVLSNTIPSVAMLSTTKTATLCCSPFSISEKQTPTTTTTTTVTTPRQVSEEDISHRRQIMTKSTSLASGSTASTSYSSNCSSYASMVICGADEHNGQGGDSSSSLNTGGGLQRRSPSSCLFQLATASEEEEDVQEQSQNETMLGVPPPSCAASGVSSSSWGHFVDVVAPFSEERGDTQGEGLHVAEELLDESNICEGEVENRITLAPSNGVGLGSFIPSCPLSPFGCSRNRRRHGGKGTLAAVPSSSSFDDLPTCRQRRQHDMTMLTRRRGGTQVGCGRRRRRAASVGDYADPYPDPVWRASLTSSSSTSTRRVKGGSTNSRILNNVGVIPSQPPRGKSQEQQEQEQRFRESSCPPTSFHHTGDDNNNIHAKSAAAVTVATRLIDLSEPLLHETQIALQHLAVD